ncbi:MAG TPA: hypothetical protein PKE29_11830 [Phycisphaerales bacterium]|nr:hypothetical protein [Phycisphaerales bacterium]
MSRSSDTAARALSRPFSAAALAKARRIAEGYRLVITPDPDVGFFGYTLEMPLAMGEGRSIAACARSVLDSTVAAIAAMIEQGQRPPAADSGLRRDQQVNIRLSAEEKLRLEALSKREGFRSLSDFVRETALRKSA